MAVPIMSGIAYKTAGNLERNSYFDNNYNLLRQKYKDSFKKSEDEFKENLNNNILNRLSNKENHNRYKLNANSINHDFEYETNLLASKSREAGEKAGKKAAIITGAALSTIPIGLAIYKK